MPEGGLRPDAQCLVDHGFTLAGIQEPQISGDQPGYRFEIDLTKMDLAEAEAIQAECAKLAPPPVQPTEAEIRVIFERWLKERECLVGLGYDPVPPPSFEKFAADYRGTTTGPWMPIDGVDTNSWTGAELRAAKEACTLEMIG